jgi:hypothetical protein
MGNKNKLDLLETLEFLNLLKEQKTLSYIAKHFGISNISVKYQRRKHHAYSDQKILDAIRDTELKIKMDDQGIERDYAKEAKCSHEHCTLFIKCPSCTLVMGEEELDRAIEVLQEKKRLLKDKILFETTI